jgi:hypothetical protein
VEVLSEVFNFTTGNSKRTHMPAMHQDSPSPTVTSQAPENLGVHLSIMRQPKHQEGETREESRGEQLEDAVVFLAMGIETIVRIMAHKGLSLRDEWSGVSKVSESFLRALPELIT